MAKVLSHGPVPSDVENVASIAFTAYPINFVADFRTIEEGPGKLVYTDVTSPVDQPSTLRIQQSLNSNVYSGTSIEPNAMLPTRKGVNTVVEFKEVWKITDSDEPSFCQYMPVRAALTLNLPTCAEMTATELQGFVGRLMASLAAQGSDTLVTGLADLLHGVVEKR